MRFTTLSSSVLIVALVALANSALAVQTVGPADSSDGRTYFVIDNVVGGDPPEFTETLDGTSGFDTNGGGFHWGTTRRWSNGGATSATWSFSGLLSGSYDIYASWRNSAQGNLGTANYVVSDGGPSVNLNQIPGAGTIPGGVLLDESPTESVNFAPIGSANVFDGTLDITASKAGGSFIFYDAIAIAPTPVPAVGDIWVIDNLEPGYSTVGFSEQANVGDAFDNNQSFNSASGDTAATATYDFVDLPIGEYQVFATWRQNGQGNVQNAEYTIDGLFSTVVNQNTSGGGPLADLVIADDRNIDFNFQSLGFVTITDTDLQVTLNLLQGGNFILGDAVAIRLESLPSAVPEPATGVLLMMGGLVTLSRRRRSRQTCRN